jgi:hypothetical protein
MTIWVYFGSFSWRNRQCLEYGARAPVNGEHFRLLCRADCQLHGAAHRRNAGERFQASQVYRGIRAMRRLYFLVGFRANRDKYEYDSAGQHKPKGDDKQFERE